MNDKVKITPLDPCAQCGAAKFQLVKVFDYYAVECADCLTTGPIHLQKEGAVSGWNKKQRDVEVKEKHYVN